MTSNGGPYKFINHIPALKLEELCQASNRSRTWYQLAVNSDNYGQDKIRMLESSNNPTGDLLTHWRHLNYTIMSLYESLERIPDYESMKILKPLMAAKDSTPVRKEKKNIPTSLRSDVSTLNNKDLKIDLKNFNCSQPIQPGSPKVIVAQNDAESATRKMINIPPNTNANFIQSQNVQSVFQPTASTSKINNQSTVSSGNDDLLEITYKQLEKLTENWFRGNSLKKGSFGTIYTAKLNQGKWKGTAVVIRKIDNIEADGSESFARQLDDLKFLSSYKNANILSLLAHGSGSGALCLVYELMTKGSLEEKLFHQSDKPLTWAQRCVIAKGVARGLHYLHTVTGPFKWTAPLVHGNIKSSNILLDKNFDPKIGDLALARICGENGDARVSRMRKTMPFLREEFFGSEHLSPTIDIYCYGFVLFELVSAELASKDLMEIIYGLTQENKFVIMDLKPEPATDNIFEDLISIGEWCTKGITMNLPAMAEVLERVNQL